MKKTFTSILFGSIILVSASCSKSVSAPDNTSNAKLNTVKTNTNTSTPETQTDQDHTGGCNHSASHNTAH